MTIAKHDIYPHTALHPGDGAGKRCSDSDLGAVRRILLATPRGFCAGVDRAIQIVERAIEKYGAPVYVRHEIVHNKRVVKELEAKGAVFVDELDQVPDHAPVIFSAHGVPKSVTAQARHRALLYLDATCPLVSKVHIEADRRHREGYEILLIGHAHHPEVIGTMGQLPAGSIHLIETVEDVDKIQPRNPERLAYLTQTTLSVDETADIVAALRDRFPSIKGPAKNDICYATTNRQEAVKQLAEHCDAMIVVGSANSSNSQRLVEVARRYGCGQTMLIDTPDQIDWSQLDNTHTIGLTAGASAPETSVQDVIAKLAQHFSILVEELVATTENVTFKLPRDLLT